MVRTSTQPLVLVVDDEPELRRLTESILVWRGYQVVVAAHGQEAMQRLREYCPDLIVLDLNMPVMDGWQFCLERELLADRTLACVPILLLTGAEGAARLADTLRAAGYLKKPFDPDDLLDAVSVATGHTVSEETAPVQALTADLL
jgi:CheY-like chemotaxis protein